MTAGVLGVAEGSELTPMTLLRQGNLALGVVAEDGEAAVEAVRKFWAAGDESSRVTSVLPVQAVPKTREAVAGTQSSVVVTLELPPVLDEALPPVLGELLAARGSPLLPDATVEVLDPWVPGHSVLLLVVTAVSPLAALETSLQKAWKALTAPVREDELVTARRRTAAAAAASWSGATGRARRCAAVAAGAARWRPASEMEMGILSVSAETANAVLSGLVRLEELPITAAGVLPIAELDRR
jgi:hypothetical protein